LVRSRICGRVREMAIRVTVGVVVRVRARVGDKVWG
jgi:hypothetical protein